MVDFLADWIVKGVIDVFFNCNFMIYIAITTTDVYTIVNDAVFGDTAK